MWVKKYSVGVVDLQQVRIETCPKGSYILIESSKIKVLIQDQDFWDVQDGKTIVF